MSSPVLVGRDRDLNRLVTAFDTVTAGTGEFVVVEGEAGVGKSRLVDELTGLIEARGGRVLSGACLPFAESVPYAPVVEILRRSGDHAAAEPAGSGEAGRIRYFTQVVARLAAIAESAPLAIVVEDLQWADRSTGDLLVYLTQAIRSAPILVVGTRRVDEPRPAGRFAGVLTELVRSGRASRVSLDRLDPSQATELVAAILGGTPEPAFVRRIVARAEGNPFFVEELVAAGGGGELPAGVRAVILGRVRRVAPNTRQLLRVAAVIGRRVGDPLLRRVAGLPSGALDEALRDAITHRLLVVDDTYSFRHALTHETVYGDLLPGERQLLHERVAVALTDDPALAIAGGPAARTAEIAHHWQHAGRPAEARAASVAAGRAAELAHAPAEAYVHYRQALSVWPKDAGVERRTVVGLAAESASLAGMHEQAAELNAALLDEIDQGTERYPIILERQIRYLRYAGRLDAARDAGRALSRHVPAEPTPTRARALCGVAAAYIFLEGRYLDALPVADAALRAARSAGARLEEGYALLNLGVVRDRLGCHHEAISLQHEGLRATQESSHPHRIAVAWHDLADAYISAGLPQEAVTVAERGLAEARQLGLDQAHVPYLAGALTSAQLAAGGWNEADDASLDAMSDTGFFFALVQLARAQLLTGRGDFDQAARVLSAVGDSLRDNPDLRRSATLCCRQIELAVWQHDWTTARAVFERGCRILAGTDDLQLVLELTVLGARLEADEVSWCRLNADPALREARAAAATRYVGRAEALQSRIESAVGRCSLPYRLVLDLARAERSRLTEATNPRPWTAIADRAGADRYLMAYARWREAEALLAGNAPGCRAAAEVALRKAYAIAIRLAAEPLLAGLRELAVRARVELPTPAGALPGPDGLTPRERQVLALLVQGMTNAEIGAALFISPRTASAHVSRILRKLGVTTRGRAAAVVHQLGSVPSESPRSPATRSRRLRSGQADSTQR